ncbi:MAG: hypothetical protein EOP74_01675 [Variovorax sp.]|nr:MAG: hypothetical protein EOP74_01675 [Variovorax sp.]
MDSIPDVARAEVGRSLGHDLYLYRSQLAVDTLDASVREGFAFAAARRPARVRPDRFARKWLQLRCNAYARGRSFDCNVTPELLSAIDLADCPVTRIGLTHGVMTDSDWSVDRLNNEAGYAANNLAVMSTRANKAKGRRTFDEVLALARSATPTHGLSPVEWMRLASMMLGPCFATAPAAAPLLPHIAPMTSHRLLLSGQQLQHVLCTKSATQAGKNRLVKAFRSANNLQVSVLRLGVLAETLHTGVKGLEHACDVWLRPGAMEALAHWLDSMDTGARGRVAEIARQLAGGLRVSSSRLESWQLGARGYAH